VCIHQQLRVSDLGTRVSSDHVITTLLDAGYESARLVLDKQPLANYARRVNQFLSYPVKGRSFEQLQSDYAELSAVTEGAAQDQLEMAYLTGWGHHDSSDVLDWVVENVESQTKRQTIYRQVIGSQTDKVMDLMLARHGEDDYEIMMKALAGNYWSLTSEQKKRFQEANKSESAKATVARFGNWHLNDKRTIVPLISLSPQFRHTESAEDLVIPRR